MSETPLERRHRSALVTPYRLVLLLAFLAMWRLTALTDFTSDDWSYHFFYRSRHVIGHPQRLTSPLEVFASIASHYRVQNGRSVAHALLQWSALAGKPWFDILNALVFVAVGQLVLRHIGPGMRRAAPSAAVYAAMFLFIPYFGQAALWMAGSVNYLWMSAVTLLTLLPWRVHVPGRRAPWPMIVVAGLAGLAGGSTNENSGGAWILMALGFMLLWWRAGARPPAWAWVGVGAAVSGLLVQLLSPGNHARQQALGGASLSEIAARVPDTCRVGVQSAGWLTTAFLLVLALRLARVRRIDDAIRQAVLWGLVGITSGLVLIVGAFNPHRAWIWTVLFLLVAIGQLGHGLQLAPSPLIPSALLGLLVGAACITYGVAHASIAQTHREVAVTLRQVEEAKRAGQQDVVVTKFHKTDNAWNALAWLPNLTANPNGTVNRWFAVYYGIRSVTVDNPDQVRR